jgi:hypothetical protein
MKQVNMLRHWKEVLLQSLHVLCETGVSTRTEIVVVKALCVVASLACTAGLPSVNILQKQGIVQRNNERGEKVQFLHVHDGDLLNLHFTPIIINVCSIEGEERGPFPLASIRMTTDLTYIQCYSY